MDTMIDTIRFERHMSLRLPSHLADEIDRRARLRSQKPSEVARQMLLSTLAIESRDAGSLYDVVDGKRRWARIKDGEIHGLCYSAEKPEFAPGYIAVPVTHEDSEPFDITQHWRLKPECVLIDADGTPARVVCTYPVVPKSMELA